MGTRSHSQKPSSRRSGRFLAQLAAILAIAAATAGVYANSLRNEFLFDDLETIVEAQGRGGSGEFTQLLSLLKGRPAYRPLRSASYGFDYALSGLDPWGYHVSNIVYHTLSALFVFFIARTLFDRMRPAVIAALLFAIHPIQTDAVTYLSGRRDVLSGLFVLMGFHAFVRYRQAGRPGPLILTVVAYLMAFFSKESGIILPLLCFSYDVVTRLRVGATDGHLSVLRHIWSAGRAALREGRVFYLPFVLLGAGLTYYVLFLVRGTWQRAYHGGSLWFTMLTEARVVQRYISLLIFPLTLNADYSYNAFPVTTSWTDPKALIAVLILVACGYGVFACLRTRPLAAFGGIWFIVALLPVSQIVPHHELMAEHYLYVPSMGFFLLAVALVDPLLDRPRSTRVVRIAGWVILLFLSLRTVWRNADWRNDLTLWSKTVQVAPEAARARNNLGAAYLRRGQLTLAQEQLETALRIRPDLASARANLGKLYLDRGDLERAEQELASALLLKGSEMIPHLWLGAVYMHKGRMDKAEQQFRVVLSRPPYDAYAYNNLGAVFARNGRVAEAEAAFLEALRRMPDMREARDNLARLYRLQGRTSLGPRPVRGALA